MTLGEQAQTTTVFTPSVLMSFSITCRPAALQKAGWFLGVIP